MRQRIVAGALLVASVACQPGVTPLPTPTTFGAADSGRTIALHVGESFDVALAENGASTGYRWEITASGAPQLQTAGDDIRGTGNPPGASVTHVFHFRAVAAGDTTLALVDRRSFGSDPPSGTFQVSVTVRP